MAKTYTREEIKQIVVEQINSIHGLKSEFTPIEADHALEEAERDCGYDFPLQTDADAQRKYRWLINRMRRWFLTRLWEKHSLSFNAGDLEAQGIVRNLSSICESLDKEFVAAVEKDGDLFASVASIFGGAAVVVAPGLVEDRVGQSVEERT